MTSQNSTAASGGLLSSSSSSSPPSPLSQDLLRGAGGERGDCCETVGTSSRDVDVATTKAAALGGGPNILGGGIGERQSSDAGDRSAAEACDEDDCSDSSSCGESSYSSSSYCSSDYTTDSDSEYSSDDDDDVNDDDGAHDLDLAAALTATSAAALDADAVSRMLARARCLPRRRLANRRPTASLDGSDVRHPTGGAELRPAFVRIASSGAVQAGGEESGSTSVTATSPHESFSSRVQSLPDIVCLMEKSSVTARRGDGERSEHDDDDKKASDADAACIIQEDTNPVDVYFSILEEASSSSSGGGDKKPPFAPIPALSITNFFLDVTQENIDAHTPEVIGAVQDGNVPALRKMHETEGKSLQCSNRFGESIVHMACRRSRAEVVSYLLGEADVTVRLRDDYGRTPMHDACWTVEPDMDMMEVLIRSCPDLLAVSDGRGYTPLHYVRREHWPRWCSFLRSRKDLLVPKEIKLGCK